ncbi:16845_t:CDS:2 [Cetraspora pellucida]|uniref:16844_t:CDS:1 n=1 Tax=Cetraspora pellucida TaxID=1433469 RepID=A0A9N8YYR1_9GLOM|nr:16844_t:CDS:2 [Cetraspora pellucida]CAG8458921.1 16845_t:CDS:2 [Cetraspora pellucida]
MYSNATVSEFSVSSTLVNTCANVEENDKELTNIDNTPFVRNILGSEFKNYSGDLLLITSPIEIKNHFAIYKHKCEIFSDGTCRKRVLKCNRGGRYNEQLLRPTLGKQKNKESKKQGLTLLNTEHNHQIDIKTIKFTTAYKSFSQEIMEQIKYYVIHGRCDATMIRNLFQPKYLDYIFLTQDLRNIIQKIKREHRINLGDMASLLTKLLEFQANDSQWFVKSLIDDTSSRLIEACEIPSLTFVTDVDPAIIATISIVFPKTRHMQCLYHLYQNLSKNLRLCLVTLYQDFLKDFKNIQHSYCEDVKCFTSRCFTAETQSTQHVESENALIQKVIQSNYSLLEVQEALENRLEFELINNHYSIWKTSTIQYIQSFVIQTFFTEFTQKYTITDLSEKWYKKILKNQLKYGALMSEAKKTIYYALQNEDNELMQFIKEFNKRKEN